MKILVTSGATREPIDAVRFISNFSTGGTGAALADAFLATGHSVHYLHGMGALLPAGPARTEQFSSYADLDRRLRRRLSSGGFDAVVHAAAVSDYSLGAVTPGVGRLGRSDRKLDSSREELTLVLRRNRKLLDRLCGYAGNIGAYIVGFKLTCTRSARARSEAAAKLSLGRGVRLVVHNDMLDIKAGRRVFTLYAAGRERGCCVSAAELAGKITENCKEALHAAGS